KLTFTETGSVTTVLLSSDEQENRCATNKGSNKKKNFCIDLINYCCKVKVYFHTKHEKTLKKV
ncbi:hypothetical protein CIK96_11520, partial [Prevotella sp. P4-98]|uniref:hypothetical protein n=1 Tax=Prevotella sp. P4-98 TaxID=2024219 RepID=UPI000BC5B45F